jgi:hypothetical protein
MRRLLILPFALVACRSSSEPTASIDVVIRTAARPTTSFVVHNRTGAATTLKVCDGKVGFPSVYTDGHATVLVCVHPSTSTELAAGDSLQGTASITSAGKYQISVTRADGASFASSPFTVP